MRDSSNKPLVTTLGERCRICYTCVRECPAKAIRIANGQAEVIAERCIGCGNCVRVCSQKAKQILDSKQTVYELLKSNNKTAAILAPSFPAEFSGIGHEKLVGMIRRLGFDYVNEVGFGADLIADRYRKLLAENGPNCKYIATSCPAIIAYVEKYHPDLVENLAPIVSPMVATAKIVRQIYGDDLRVVFIGPCIAKKGEIASVNMDSEVDASLTFIELREMLEAEPINPDEVKDSNFDEPFAGVGAIFPISGGLFQSAGIEEDLIRGDIVAVEGGSNFVEAFKEFESGDMNVQLLEVLACNGCIMGPGISNTKPLFNRRASVSGYVREKMKNFDKAKWEKDVKKFDRLDLSRRFAAYDQRIKITQEDELEHILKRMGKNTAADELNCGACGYNTCREHALAIWKGLAESEMCLPYTIEQLHKTIDDLASSNNQLANTQEALMQSEKLASMGQLAAGVAHEINNPLGVVLMYAHLLQEKCQNDRLLRDDLRLIAEQADRCKKIVGGLLNFARKSKAVVKPTDIYDIIEKSIQSVPNEKCVEIMIESTLEDRIAELDGDQMSQVFSNLVANAIAATDKTGLITVLLGGDNQKLYIKIIDTGRGIAKENISKIFEPFFTTKQIGDGTGLGLAVAYGIVKMHRGDIKVESNSDVSKGPTGTTFTVILPRRQMNGFQ
ncbi:MAG: [Fe-Fe] hydrogenase large subunit C-terminal domain-containing protein [Phycisphaerae bacterium]|nr:[Fe-Fe] hydrogenase large subunit C-terminal domain-containing protein [Phycisphaerae bacterium]